MKHATWDNPNKMHIDTGYKLFDKQTNVISYGNVYANTQTSSYIPIWKLNVIEASLNPES